MSKDPSPDAIAALVRAAIPGAEVEAMEPFAADAAARDANRKATGYGAPQLVTVRSPAGRARLVLHTEAANDFGHDRRADRAAQSLLAFDTFGSIPAHVRALAVGAVRADGTLVSLSDAGELVVLTTFAEGRPYAQDLREVAARGRAEPRDLERCGALVRLLVEIHAAPGPRPEAYTRAIRDLVGHGEGVFGLVDAYGADVPAASPARLRDLEHRLVDWRWRLRGRAGRLRRTHGDFHPFNIVFDDGGRPALLDASRGGFGDPADDVTCLALNFVFFALQTPGAWPDGFGPLWRRAWSLYLETTGDRALLEVAPPFLAWRALVMCCPRWYPDLSAEVRDRLLSFVERALDAGRFDPESAEGLFP